MKAENKKMATDLTTALLPKFKGLSEKSAIKMVKAIEDAAEGLAKKFHKLHDDDKDAANKLLKKAAKKQEKVADKEAKKKAKSAAKSAKKAKIAVITGSTAAPKAPATPKAAAPAKKLAAKAAPARKAPAKKPATPPVVAASNE